MQWGNPPRLCLCRNFIIRFGEGVKTNAVPKFQNGQPYALTGDKLSRWCKDGLGHYSMRLGWHMCKTSMIYATSGPNAKNTIYRLCCRFTH